MIVSSVVEHTEGGFTFGVQWWGAVLVTRSVSGFVKLSKQSVDRSVKYIISGLSSDTCNRVNRVWNPNIDDGHLVALEFGGIDHGVNVVPMFGYINRRGPWRAMEREVSECLANARSGGILTVDVIRPEPTDDLATCLIPVSFNVKLVVMNEYGGAHTKYWTIENAAPTSFSHKQRDLSEALATFRGLEALWGRVSDHLGEDNLLKRLYGDTADGRGLRAYWEDLSPYKALDLCDYLGFNNFEGGGGAALDMDLHDFLKVSNPYRPLHYWRGNRAFSDDQRATVLLYNAALNGGVVRSDDPLDYVFQRPHYPYHVDEVFRGGGEPIIIEGMLTCYGSGQGPEVDHIFPRGGGGSNIFGNSRVISGLHNRLKSSKGEFKDVVVRRSTRFLGF